MEQLKFKNYLFATIYFAVFITIVILLGNIICIVGCYVFDGIRDFIYFWVVCLALIIGVWIIAGITIAMQKTVIVTNTEIKLCRRNKIKWIIEKSEIKECIYNRGHWYDFLMPISAINAYLLQFKLKEKGISRKKYCFLSYKQVKRICIEFNYPVRAIDSVFEQ